MISLKQWMSTVASNISTHVGTLIGGGAVHGISGWGGAPEALGPAAATGDDATIARGDHVHPTTGLLLTTDRGGTPVALGAAAAEGNATTVARSNHVHPYPTAANVGAMATTHAANAITGFGSSATALGTSSAGTATTVSRSDHRHAMPSAADVGALPASGGTLAGNLALSIGGGSRIIDIGTGRTADGWSYVRFFSTSGGAVDASIFRAGGLNSELVIHQERGTGGVLFRVPAMNVRNQANSDAAPLTCGAVAATSVTVNGVAVSVSGHTHDYAATGHAHGNMTSDGKLGSTANLPVITGTGGAVTTGSFGTGANTFCQGNDSRLSDARTPTSHTHGNLSNDGKVGGTANLPLITGTAGAITAGSFGTTANTFCQGNDSRLSNARAPTSHTHTEFANDFALTASSGSRYFSIGSGRGSNGQGNSILRFYSANSGVLSADLVADGGSGAPFRIRHRITGGDIRLQAATSYCRNAADNGYGDLYVGHIGYQSQANDSDPRIKRDITPASARVSPRALADTTIRFNFQSEPVTERQRLGFDAARLRDIAPDIVRSRPPVKEESEAGLSEVLGFDPIGMLAIVVQQVADLADRVEALESRR